MTWRLSGVFWIAAVLLAGSTNFVVKHTVQKLDDDLNGARRKTIAQQKQIHDLTAEWTYLNQPELLSDLNRRYIGLVPVTPKQIQRGVDDIPLRPVAAPPAETPIEPIPVAAAIPPPAAAPPAPVMAMPAPVPVASPIVPVAAASVARVSPAPAAANPIVPAVATTAARVPPPPLPTASVAAAPARAPSLDALFAQVAGGR